MTDDRFHPKVLQRSVPKRFKKSADKYAQLTGTVTWASNRLQSQFALLFAVAITPGKLHGPDHLKPGIAIFNALKSDDAQREILRAAIDAMLPTHRLRKRLLWTIEMAGKLATYRNDATHTPVRFKEVRKGMWKVEPEPYTGQPKRVTRIIQVGYRPLFKTLAGDLLALGQYVNALRPDIANPGSFGPLPQKPKLRTPQLVERSKPVVPLSTSRKRKRAARKSRP